MPEQGGGTGQARRGWQALGRGPDGAGAADLGARECELRAQRGKGLRENGNGGAAEQEGRLQAGCQCQERRQRGPARDRGGAARTSG